MKKLISIIIITLGFLPLMAQNDYYIKQAQSYQREAEYYTKQALGYEQEVDYYNRQAQGYLREAEYYSKRKLHSISAPATEDLSLHFEARLGTSSLYLKIVQKLLRQ